MVILATISQNIRKAGEIMIEKSEFDLFNKNEDKNWDVFISHASEDKEELVRPLAEALQRYGVKVWYDEFELKMGDSLSDSINRGLQKSKYGIVVCSPAFFEKKWTDYELKSLLMRQLDNKRIILPIWHKINKDFIAEKSLYFLDIKALSSDMKWDELIDGILQVIRPDIINSHLLLKMGKEIHKEVDKLPKQEIPVKDLIIAPVRHKALPFYLVVATRLICEVFKDVLKMDYKEMVTDFARDLDYDNEFVIWSAMANSYIEFIREIKCEWNDVDKKAEAASLLLEYTYKGQLEQVSNLKEIQEKEYYYLIKLFLTSYNEIMTMIEKYN